MLHQLIAVLLILHLIPGLYGTSVQEEVIDISEIADEGNRVERAFENVRNDSDRPKIIKQGIGKVERDIIISVLIVACVTPLVCGILMIACQLATRIKKKHIRRRLGMNKRTTMGEYSSHSPGVSKRGPLQLHDSFPVYFNGITREEMECYMNMTALAIEQGLCANSSIGRNNPETGQIEGDEAYVPLTPPHVRIKPRIAIQYPSPPSSPLNVNGVFSPLGRNTRNLYPPLSLVKSGMPVFTMQPKNSTPRSPLDTFPQAKHRPAIQETPGRAVKKKRLDLLRQMTMSPPPSYTSTEAMGRSMPCLSYPGKGSPYTSLNVSSSGALKQKDRSASESDLSV